MKRKHKMKKTLIAMLLIMAVLAAGCGNSTTSTTATEEPAASVEPTDEVTESPDVDEEVTEFIPSYIVNQVTVIDVSEEMLQTTLDAENAEDQNNLINYILSTDTLVYDVTGNKLDISAVQAGSLISVYTNSSAPAALVLPTEYQADIIIVENTEDEAAGFTCADTFVMRDEMLTGMGNTLALNIATEGDESTVIVDTDDDNAIDIELENMDILVFYENSTRSVPAQTTPTKIVVLGLRDNNGLILKD
jgi:hypothetical protein